VNAKLLHPKTSQEFENRRKARDELCRKFSKINELQRFCRISLLPTSAFESAICGKVNNMR
jgi:hypothetical protein